MSLFSVIIPTYQRPDELRGCLKRLAPGIQSLSFDQYEIVVTDDEGEASSTRKVVAEEFPWAKWVAGPGRGVAANRNNGATHARSDWLVFTDDDCRPSEQWLSVYHRAAQNGGAEVLEGKTVAEGNRPGPGWTAPVNQTGGKLWSCNLAVRQRAFEKIGGFDEGYPSVGVEDVDFRTQIRRRSMTVRFVSEATVVHPWRKSRSFQGQVVKGRGWHRFFRKFPAEVNRYNFNYHIGTLVDLFKWGGLAPFRKDWRREAGVQVRRAMKSAAIIYQGFRDGH